MPIYEYECPACRYRLEKFQRFCVVYIETCPQCEEAMEQLISKCTFQLKGTGWYATDYAKERGAKDAKCDRPSSSGFLQGQL